MRRVLRRPTLKVRHALGSVRERLRRRGPPVVELERVKRRLELLVAGLYGRAIPVAALDDSRRSLLTRFAAAITVGRMPVRILATNDGESVRLPRRLDADAGDVEAITRYQLLALEQAERVARGSARLTPAAPLERDLFHIAEGHAVDAALVARAPRLADTVRGARAMALTRRPKLEVLFPLDRRVEELARYALGSEPPMNTLPLPTGAADDSLAWARDTAAALTRGKPQRYLGLTPIALWGAPGVVRDAEEEPVERLQKFDLDRRLGVKIETKGGEAAPAGA